MQKQTKLLIVGRTASGKDYLADFLKKKYGLSKVHSYTTRPKRRNEANTHIFLENGIQRTYFLENRYEIEGTIEGKPVFFTNEEIIAYTKINHHIYFATKQQLEESDIYVIDPEGLKELLSKTDDRNIYRIIYVNTSENNRKAQFMNREKIQDVNSAQFQNRNQSESARFEKFETEELSSLPHAIIVHNQVELSDEVNFKEVIKLVESEFGIPDKIHYLNRG